MPTPTTIVICVRSGFERTGWIHPLLSSWMISLIYEPIHRLNCDLVFGVQGLAASSNAAAKGFLERSEFVDVEWLCIVDNDTVPPRDILRMLDDVPTEVDILSPTCHMTWSGHVFPQQGFYKDDNMNPAFVSDGPCAFYPLISNEPGLYEVDRVGGGCWFIRRRVFASMTKPYFQIRLDPETHGTDMTDDIYFQDQAKKLGFHLFADTRFLAAHYHSMNLATLPMDVQVVMPDCGSNIKSKMLLT